MVSLTLKIDDDVDAALRRQAAASGKSVDEVVGELVRRFAAEQAYLAAVDEGIEEADRGDVVDGDEVFDALRARLEGMRTAR
jgi:predicted transcriptional regulator